MLASHLFEFIVIRHSLSLYIHTLFANKILCENTVNYIWCIYGDQNERAIIIHYFYLYNPSYSAEEKMKQQFSWCRMTYIFVLEPVYELLHITDQNKRWLHNHSKLKQYLWTLVFLGQKCTTTLDDVEKKSTGQVIFTVPSPCTFHFGHP